MKKILIASALMAALVSCNNDANDGDASTDTTNFNSLRDTNTVTNIGDTSIDISDTGAYSHPGMTTGNDSAKNIGPGNNNVPNTTGNTRSMSGKNGKMQ